MQRLYQYSSSAGMLWIAQDPQRADRVWLGIDETPIRDFPSARAAAEAVHRQGTGWHPVDELHGANRPRGLAEWTAGTETSSQIEGRKQ